MAQHFLLSAEARTLNLRSVMSMTESRAYAKVKRVLWSETGGEPVCPKCGCLDHWTLAGGRKWRCNGCRTAFTVTSDTILKSRKLPFRTLLAAMAIFTNGALGVAACRLQREIDVSYKTAFVLAHKLREAMGLDHLAVDVQLEGVVEVDGAVFGGKPRRLPNEPDKWEEYRRNYREEARKKKKLIVVIRERTCEKTGKIGRVRVFRVSKEGDAVAIVRDLLKKGTIVHADESTQYDPLHAFFDTKRIKHAKWFSDGIACTNQAESFFSRMRRAERGVYNSIGRNYTLNYAREMAWREENRRMSNGDQFITILSNALKSKVSRKMKGYWQRRSSDNDNDPDGIELRAALGI